jgi:hypothetical protein
VEAQARERIRQAGHEWRGATRITPARRLHLDHVGAEPSEDHRAEAGARVGQVEDTIRG